MPVDEPLKGVAEVDALLIVKHFTTHRTDEEREGFIPRRDHFVGKSLRQKRHVVDAANWRV
jgi:hypothetical protein